MDERLVQETPTQEGTLRAKCYRCGSGQLHQMYGVTDWNGHQVPYQFLYDPQCRGIQSIELGEIIVPLDITTPLSFDPRTVRLSILDKIRRELVAHSSDYFDTTLFSPEA